MTKIPNDFKDIPQLDKIKFPGFWFNKSGIWEDASPFNVKWPDL